MAKVLTVDGEYKDVSQIENPDEECADPGEYWDIVTAPRNEDE